MLLFGGDLSSLETISPLWDLNKLFSLFIFPQEHRVRYNQHYSNVFHSNSEHLVALELSEQEPSLLNLVEKWLERTPGLEKDGFDFWTKYQRGVQQMLDKRKDSALVRTDS